MLSDGRTNMRKPIGAFRDLRERAFRKENKRLRVVIAQSEIRLVKQYMVCLLPLEITRQHMDEETCISPEPRRL
jgi:hypothetical protein